MVQEAGRRPCMWMHSGRAVVTAHRSGRSEGLRCCDDIRLLLSQLCLHRRGIKCRLHIGCEQQMSHLRSLQCAHGEDLGADVCQYTPQQL